MKQRMLIALALLGISACTARSQDKPPIVVPSGALTLKDFGVRTENDERVVYYGDTIETARAILGAPSGRKVFPKNEPSGDFIWDIYEDGLIIGSYENRRTVALIRIRDDNHYTPRGLTVGDTREDVVDRYGSRPGDVWEQGIQHSLTVQRGMLEFYYLLTFDIESGRVTEININVDMGT